MEVIGEKLKASREEKGLSLEEVSEDLKIEVKDLKNIESGNRNNFDDVFVLKNYIYEYSKYLGLDSEKVVEEFNEFMFEYTSKIPSDAIERISKQKEEEELAKGAMSPYTIVDRRNYKKEIIIVAGVILLIIAMIIIFKLTGNTNNDLVLSAFI